MKILLIQPPLHDFYATPHRTNALGLHLAAKMLTQAGHEAEVINFPLLPGGREVPLPDGLDYLKPYIVPGEKGPVSGLNRFQRFGPAASEACGLMESRNADLIVLGLFAWAFGEDLFELAREYKKRNPTRPLGIAGAGFTAAPECFVVSGLFSLFLEGEAEGVIPAWLNAGAPREGHFAVPADPDRNPIPVALAQRIPGKGGKPGKSAGTGNEGKPGKGANKREGGEGWAISLSAGRGCPMACRFCANHLVHGRGLRLPPVGAVMREIERIDVSSSLSGDRTLLEDRGNSVRNIYIEDDNPSAEIRWFKELLTALHDRYPEAEISAENGMDHRFLSAGDLPFLWEKGFRVLNLSLASANPATLSKAGRSGSREHFAEIVTTWAAMGGRSVQYFIAGLPGDSGEEALKSLVALSRLPGRAGVSLYYPLPGEDPEAPFRRSLGSAAWSWGGELSTPSLLTIFRLSRYLNMMKKERKDPVEELLIKESRKKSCLHTLRWKDRSMVPLPWTDGELVSRFFYRVEH